MKLSAFLNDIKSYVSNYKKSADSANSNIDLGKIIDCPVFIINLERSKLRRDFILKYLSSLGIEATIFPAVEGNKLDLAELEKNKIYDNDAALEAFSRPLSMPEIGCTMSHIGIYHKIIDEGIEKALVLEDDVIFCDDIDQHFTALIDEVPDDWELIQLYYKCQDFTKITDNIVKFRSETCLPSGSAGYFINRSGAEKMLKAVYPVRYPADSLIGRSPRWDTVVYGSSSALLTQNYLYPTEIQARSSFTSSLRDGIKAMIVKIIGKFYS